MMGRRRARRTATSERGSALVETAIVASLLFMLLFGIVTFGLLLAFRQNMVQAATEATRAGAVAEHDDALARAQLAAENAVSGFDKSCADDGDDGLQCTATLEPCPASAVDLCVHVVVSHSNIEDPVVAPLPFVSMFVPDEMTVEAYATVDPS
jgi:Flp pilus assembly protein TadG